MEDPYSSSDSAEDYGSARSPYSVRSHTARYLGCAAVVALAASCAVFLLTFHMNGGSSDPPAPSDEPLSAVPQAESAFTRMTSAPTSPPIAEQATAAPSLATALATAAPSLATAAPTSPPIAERVSADPGVMQIAEPELAAAPAAEGVGTDSCGLRAAGPPAAAAKARWDLAGGCFQEGAYYTELSGRHSMPLGQRTEEVSPQACQLLCARTAGCAHFSFWGDGGCLLTSYTAYRERYAGPEASVVAGPRNCTSVTAGPTLDLEAALDIPPFVAREASGCGSLHSSYDLSWKAEGSTFFDDFQFSTLSETHGAEWYVNKTEAFRLGIVETTDTNAVIRVGDQVMPFKRRSVMLRSARAWRPDTGFVMAMKYKHVPYGAGIWPAFWLMNSDYLWPQGGELDILEYANDAESKVTFHTNKNCSLNAAKLAQCMNGPNVDRDVIQSCYTNYTANDLGCKPPQIRRTGKWFAEHPGVIATVWDESGLSVFHIPEAEVPPDLLADTPNPNTWERWLIAYLPFDPQTCFDIAKPQEIVLNIALCGDWAGGAWYGSEEARATGFLPPYCIPGHVSEPATDCCTIFISSPTAEEYLRKRAYFDVEYIKVFEPAGSPPSTLSSGSYRNEGVPLAEPCVPCGEPRWIPKGSHSRANVCCGGCGNATYYWNDVCNCGGTLVCKAEAT